MDPASITAAITLGQTMFSAGQEVYGMFMDAIRACNKKIPGLDAIVIDREIRSASTKAADAAVDAEIDKATAKADK